MKKKEFGELKTKKREELIKMISQKKLELTQIMGKIYAGREKNLKKGKNLRREISQLMTIVKEHKNKQSL